MQLNCHETTVSKAGAYFFKLKRASALLNNASLSFGSTYILRERGIPQRGMNVSKERNYTRFRLITTLSVLALALYAFVYFVPVISQPENGDFTICQQYECIHHIRVIDSIGYHYLGWGGQLLWPSGYQVVPAFSMP